MWILPAVKQNGFAYYKYLKTYVDDVICVSEAPELTMKGFMEQVKLKNDFVGPPESFIGAQLAFKCINGVDCWTMTSQSYLKEAIKNVERSIKDKGLPPLQSKALTPLSSKHKPKLDISAECYTKETKFYQELVGILQWAVEIGQVDINLEVYLYAYLFAITTIQSSY